MLLLLLRLLLLLKVKVIAPKTALVFYSHHVVRGGGHVGVVGTGEPIVPVQRLITGANYVMSGLWRRSLVSPGSR